MAWIKKDMAEEPAYLRGQSAAEAATSARSDRVVVRVELDASVIADALAKELGRRLQVTISEVGVSESDEGAGVDERNGALSFDARVPGASDEQPLPSPELFADDALDGRDDQVGSLEEAVASEVVDDDAAGHESSPFEGVRRCGCSGAGCDERDPTEETPAGSAGEAEPATTDLHTTEGQFASSEIALKQARESLRLAQAAIDALTRAGATRNHDAALPA